MNPVALYGFQRAGVSFLLAARRAILGDDMGLGKTAQAISACEAAGCERVLVICPNTLKSNWYVEISKWAPHATIRIVRGTSQEKSKAIRSFDHGYLIVNIECVRRGRGAFVLVDDLLSRPWDVLIVDEAHCIKSRTSQQTKGVYELACRTGRVYLLTGTPIMNRVDDLWAPLHVLYPRRYASFWSFVKKHTIAFRGRFGWVIDGKPTQPKLLRLELAPVFLRREKEEVFPDMPRKVYQQLWLDLEDEQRRIYKDIEQKAMTEVDATTTVVTPGILAQLTRCKQVAVSPGLIGGRPEGVKLDALLDIIRGTDQKVIVFSQFAEAVKLAAGRLKEEGIGYVVLIGETKEEDRHAVIERFQTSAEARVFLATTQAGGSGITLTAASLVVFLDKHWTPAVNEQAVDRTRPHMQTRPVQVVELLARDTVDEMIEDVLAGKVSIIEAVINRKKGERT